MNVAEGPEEWTKNLVETIKEGKRIRYPIKLIENSVIRNFKKIINAYIDVIKNS